jgi:hypothetical protein
MNAYHVEEALAAIGLLLLLGIYAASCVYWYTT